MAPENLRDDLGPVLRDLLEDIRTGQGQDKLAEHVQAGRFFIGGAAIPLGGAFSSNRATLQLLNPVGSGKVATVVAMTLYSSIAQQVRFVEDAAMNGTVTAYAPRDLNRITRSVSAMELSASVDAPTGGDWWTNETRVSSTQGKEIKLPGLILGPGRSIAVHGTEGASQVFTANVYYIETPIA